MGIILASHIFQITHSVFVPHLINRMASPDVLGVENLMHSNSMDPCRELSGLIVIEPWEISMLAALLYFPLFLAPTGLCRDSQLPLGAKTA